MGRETTTRLRGRKWMKLRDIALQRTSYLCAECRRNDRLRAATQVDHIKPLHKGGTDHPDNLEGLCLTCHEVKTAKDMGYKAKPKIGLDGWPE